MNSRLRNRLQPCLLFLTIALVGIGTFASIYSFTAGQYGSLPSTDGPCLAGAARYGSSTNVSSLESFEVEGLCVMLPNDNTTVIGGLVYVATTISEDSQGFQSVNGFGDCNGVAISLPCVGMLFATPRERNLCFWMHDTQIPLQQVWISPTGAVVATYLGEPNSDTTVCHTAQFGLETNPLPHVAVRDRVVVYKPPG